MKNLTLRNIARACAGIYHGLESDSIREVTAVTTDSREVCAGCLFVPVVGQRVDAHRFIPDVMAQGALCTLSEQELGETDFPWIKVTSSLQAVKDLAEFYLQQLAIPVVGITGSVGKTSTKELVAAVLSQKYQVLKTQGNFNNELGLPLTVFRLRDSDEIAVLEMGISEFGEMSRLARIARPDTCIITNIGQCHLETLGDRDGVLKAKTEMLPYVRQEGHIILNGDDDKLVTVGESDGIQPFFFGLREDFPVHASGIESLGLRGMRCQLHLGLELIPVTIPVPGLHNVYNAMAAAAAGMMYGLHPEEIRQGIETANSIDGRFRLIETPQFLIVDDCYNANPMSVRASLAILQEGPGRKVAILGDMGELGSDAEKLHEELGAYAARLQIDLLICVGELSRHLAERARREDPIPQVVCFENRQELLDHLSDYLQEKDTILVKASHFMAFDEVVEALEHFPL